MIDMTKKMSTAAIHGTDPVSKVMIKKFETVSVELKCKDMLYFNIFSLTLQLLSVSCLVF